MTNIILVTTNCLVIIYLYFIYILHSHKSEFKKCKINNVYLKTIKIINYIYFYLKKMFIHYR